MRCVRDLKQIAAPFAAPMAALAALALGLPAPALAATAHAAPVQAQVLFPGGPGAVVTISGGQTVVNFGARLFINPGQPPGIYAGDFTVYLEYH